MATSETTQQIALPISADLHRRIRVAAAHDEVSMNAWIRAMLTFAVQKSEQKRPQNADQ
jgi:predicted HicB family RNase H-like nuclease